ncbi:MAG: D-alanyl-D-alanine carboxypeptidase family protein [Christensenellales bacterium]|nr:D-alanyl-D-alanine carboxypeptidase family protein [Christensenellales bacterium]
MGRIMALLLVLGILSATAAGAEVEFSTASPIQMTEEPPSLSGEPLLEAPPFTLSCASAMLLEPRSGQVLFELNGDTPRAVASVTKIMTILLTLEAIDAGRIGLDDTVTVSEDASGMGGSQVLLDAGEVQTVSELLKSMIVGSANDASVAMAEALYGSEALCVSRMNERARELGMTDTVFKNCTGLPAEGQHTTARDVARMSVELFGHDRYFEYAGIWLDEVDHGDGRKTQLTNTNKLIRLYDGCDGGKTGSTNEAGYCISATAERGGMRLIAIVLGSPDSATRFNDVEEMFDFGFANYRLYPVAEKGAMVRGTLPVTGGEAEGVALALDGALTLLILKGEEQGIRLEPELPEAIEAPVRKGDPVGQVQVIVEGKRVASIPVVAAGDVDARGLMPALQQMLGEWIFSEIGE